MLLGLVGSAIVLAVVEMRPPASTSSPATVLSDCDGAIDEIVIHYVTEAGPIVGSAYRDFLRQLPSEVVVRVVCPDLTAFDDLVQRVGSTDCRLDAVAVGHPITTWSRDRWLCGRLAFFSIELPIAGSRIFIFDDWLSWGALKPATDGRVKTDR